jgi:hypothetical protein
MRSKGARSSQITPGGCDREGNGKSRSLRDVQSAFRAHLAGIEKATSPVRCRRTGQYRATQSIFDKALRLGEKVRAVGKKRISLEDLRKVLGLEVVKDGAGSVIQQPPLSLWANLRQRALDPPILEINNKTDLKIEVESLERSKHRRVAFVTFSIEEQGLAKG